MRHCLRAALCSGAALAALTAPAFAQDTDEEDEIVVVGTQIVGSDIAGILPVTVLTQADIEVTGAVSGDELLASIPQLGDVSFREGRFSGINAHAAMSARSTFAASAQATHWFFLTAAGSCSIRVHRPKTLSRSCRSTPTRCLSPA